VLEESGLHLLAQEFLVNQAVEDRAAIIVGELAERAAVEQGFIAQRFVPVALQDNVPVDGGYDAVDPLRQRALRQR
jgi:hypothetical protein